MKEEEATELNKRSWEEKQREEPKATSVVCGWEQKGQWSSKWKGRKKGGGETLR